MGANPQPNVEGCFVDSGALTIPDYKMTITYTYEPLSDNVLFRAFEGFSEFAQDFLGECEGNCPYPVYTNFYDYYGVYDYGDNLISSAFDGSSTMLGNGNMDFSNFGGAARAGTRMSMARTSHEIDPALTLIFMLHRIHQEVNSYDESLDVDYPPDELRY